MASEWVLLFAREHDVYRASIVHKHFGRLSERSLKQIRCRGVGLLVRSRTFNVYNSHPRSICPDRPLCALSNHGMWTRVHAHTWSCTHALTRPKPLPLFHITPCRPPARARDKDIRLLPNKSKPCAHRDHSHSKSWQSAGVVLPCRLYRKCPQPFHKSSLR